MYVRLWDIKACLNCYIQNESRPVRPAFILFITLCNSQTALFLLSGNHLDQDLNDGQDPLAGIDIHRTVFFILIVGTQADGAVGDQGAVLLAGQQNGDGPAPSGLFKNRKIPLGISMGRDHEEYRIIVHPFHQPL